GRSRRRSGSRSRRSPGARRRAATGGVAADIVHPRGRFLFLVRSPADGDLQAGVADDDLISRLELGLVDLLAVHEGPLRGTQVDDAHVTGARDLDDGMHPTDAVIVQ